MNTYCSITGLPVNLTIVLSGLQVKHPLLDCDAISVLNTNNTHTLDTINSLDTINTLNSEALAILTASILYTHGIVNKWDTPYISTKDAPTATQLASLIDIINKENISKLPTIGTFADNKQLEHWISTIKDANSNNSNSKDLDAYETNILVSMAPKQVAFKEAMNFFSRKLTMAYSKDTDRSTRINITNSIRAVKLKESKSLSASSDVDILLQLQVKLADKLKDNQDTIDILDIAREAMLEFKASAEEFKTFLL